MSEPSSPLDPTVVAPLLHALRHPDRAARGAIVRALARLPLSATDWIDLGGYVRHALTVVPEDPEPSYAIDRETLIAAAAFVPTRGARERLLEIADHGVADEQRLAIDALVRARDPRVVPILLTRLSDAPAGDDTWILDVLSACDLSQADEMLLVLRTLAQRHPDVDARFWLSAALGRAGHAAPFVSLLREIADGRVVPGFLHGSPFRVTEELARRGPYPEPMRNVFKRVAEDASHPMRNIFGDLLEALQAPYVTYIRQPPPSTDDPEGARARAHAAADRLEREFRDAPAVTPSVDVDALRHLDPRRATALVTSLFSTMASQAEQLPPGGSNFVVEIVGALGTAYAPNVDGLFAAFVAARGKSYDLMRHIAWAASRDGLEPVLHAVSPRLDSDEAAVAAEFVEQAAIWVTVFWPPMFGSGPGVPDVIPRTEMLIDDEPREAMMANGGGRSAEPPEAAPPRAPDMMLYPPLPEKPPIDDRRVVDERVVNTGFCPFDSGDPDDEMTPNDPLVIGARYRFWIDVGAPRATSIEVTPMPLPRDQLPQTARLLVALFAFPDEVAIVDGKDVGEWKMHANGSVTVVKQPARVPKGTPRATAAVRLYFPVQAPNREGVFRLRCNLYHDQVLLQSRLIEVKVVARHRVIGGALRSVVDYTIGKTLHPKQLAGGVPHRLSLMLNDNDGDTHGFRLFGADQRALFKNDATLDGAQLGKLVQQARGALRLAAWGDEGNWDRSKAYRYDAAPDLDRLRADLARMAIRGRRFYAAVISALSGGRPKADALAKLMRMPGLVQLANKHSARHVVPLALFYDYPLDTNAADLTGYQLCPDFVAATRGSGPLEEGPCFQGRCPLADDKSNRTTICPSGFWGYRHAIGLPLSVPSAPDPPAKIVHTGHPEFAVGVATDPAFILRSSHEARLRALQPRPVWNYADTRGGVLDLLRTAHPHVVYFYCHGGVQNDVPYLVVGNNDPVITPDNLFDDVYWGDGVRPLVFINGCHTTALEPESALEFVTAFVDNAAAAGVVGTEITIFEPLARAFAEDCLKRFLAGVPIGESVRRARLALLKEGNPLGLVYIPFVIPELRLSTQET